MTNCWEWPHARPEDGRAYQRHTYVYRVTYEIAHGPIPEGHVIDHTCGNPACVNPGHLQALTQSEHVKAEHRRGTVSPGDANVGQAAKTHCPQGHPYSGENLYVSPDGDRHCRECNRAAKRRYRQRRTSTP